MKPIADIQVKGEWLSWSQTRRVFELLEGEKAKTLVAGGAVRNALLGQTVSDVDFATEFVPDEVVSRLEKGGFKVIPTGIEHGTVTAVFDNKSFEITTLREDIETDGRHAVVLFGTNWENDARRRDFTMNALYCDGQGRVYDPLDGIGDLQAGTVRFIGNPTDRIIEDALRILRFFRFFAWFGTFRPDAAGLKACSSARPLLKELSSERVWAELKKLLQAPDPGRALLWMRTARVLTAILPESEKWGIDYLPILVAVEKEKDWEVDALLRLMTMIRPDEAVVTGLAKRLTLSNRERNRLLGWAKAGAPERDISQAEFEKRLYQADQQAIVDVLRLEAVALKGRDEDAGPVFDLIETAENWQRPEFPVAGKDLLERGDEPGEAMGRKLADMESRWIESGFRLTKEELLSG